MSSQYMRSYRGMQVHAVPENERAFDVSGRKLPWGYAASTSAGLDTETERGRDGIEKGPFGRSMRRARGGTSRSRSKTAEPKKEEDRLRAEQMAAEDAVFGSLRRINREESRRETAQTEGESPEMIGAAPQTSAGTSVTVESEREPTEVLLYGFGEDLQWAAIDFFERVSDGIVLEDYDRSAPSHRITDISSSYGRIAAQRSLGKAALRKKNHFAGGNHWIKITFDSRHAAELACARSPHIIKGHLVYAEPYLGHGPARDQPIYASQAGAQITSNLPKTFAITHPRIGAVGNDGRDSSSTLSAATNPTRGESVASSATLTGERNDAIEMTASSTALQAQAEPRPLRRSRIEGAVPVTLLSAEQALMPKRAKQSWFAWLGATELIGTTVPKREDGSFDWDRASFYWRLFWFLDLIFGTDLCGLKSE